MIKLFMNRKNWMMLLLCLTVPLVFTACGGGGGGGGDGTSPGGSTGAVLASSYNLTGVTANGVTLGGNLIAPVTVGSHTYYYWDVSGDGTSAGVDYVTHDLLDQIFNGGTDTTDTPSTNTVTLSNGMTIHLLTQAELVALYNANGTPAGWSGLSYGIYWTATQAASGVHNYMVLYTGLVSMLNDTSPFCVPLEVVTATTPDTTPPTVSSVSPANSATAVAVNTAITATFSETMDASTVSTATFTLNNGVTGTVTYSGTTATFTPSSNLAYSTTYTAMITTGAKDAAGNAMAAAYTWSFTTGTLTAPTLLGGAMQGNLLNLAGTVSTYAAGIAPGSTDATGTAARFNYPQSITTDGINLYVADTVNHTIRKIVISSGVVTTLAGTAGTSGSADGTGAAALFKFPQGITMDATNLYVTDRGNNTIRKIVISSGVVTTLAGSAGTSGSADGAGVVARFNYPFGITTDATNLYVTDTKNNTIRKIVISSGMVTTLAGSAGTIGSADGAGAVARFNYPFGITTDGTNLFVANDNAIRKIVVSSGVVSTLAGTAGVIGASDGTGTAASFSWTCGITTDGANLYVTEVYNNTIRKIVISTGVVTTLAGGAYYDTNSTDDTGTAARFNNPYGITTNGGNLYVTDTFSHTIRKVVISSDVVTTLAGTSPIGSTDGTGTAVRFNNPGSITTDGTSLYVADTNNNTIRKIGISTGAVTTLAGTPGVQMSSTDGTGAAARFSHPSGITTDGTNLYVTDSGHYTIRKIVISSGVVTTLAGSSGVYGSTDGTGAVARFNYPSGITTDGINLYVTDNNTIRKIVISSGMVTTFAGTAGTSGSYDGTGAAARFNLPHGLATDGTNLYVTDSGNYTIRKVVISSGVVTTLAGTAGTSGLTDATGTAALFNFPSGITMDGTNLYVTEANNNTIRQVVISSGAVTTLAGTAGTSGLADATGTAARFNHPQGITTDGTNLYVTDTYNHAIRKIQ